MARFTGFDVQNCSFFGSDKCSPENSFSLKFRRISRGWFVSDLYKYRERNACGIYRNFLAIVQPIYFGGNSQFEDDLLFNDGSRKQ